MRRLALAILILAMPMAAHAGPAEQACLRSDRSPGPRVCACAQAMADTTLSRADQKVAARIISDPDLFQTYLKKKGRRAEAFVERYRIWGERVETHCAPRT